MRPQLPDGSLIATLALALLLVLVASVGIITISIGVAQARPDDSLRDLLDRADQALYQAKMGGRNQVQRG